MSRSQVSSETIARSVKQLVERVKAGSIRIPAFQRAPKWKTQNVVDLLDSVWRGYPIGTLLLSKNAAIASPLRFGVLAVEAPAVPDAWWVVDGQQRLTALAATLEHPAESPARDIHAIWFDLENDEFFRNDGRRDVERAVPVRALGSHTRLLAWVRGWPFEQERGDLVTRAFNVSEALLGYQVPLYIVDSSERDVLGEIFRRSNTSGVTMTETEVFQGLYREAALGLDEVQRRLSDIGFDDGEDVDQPVQQREQELLLRCFKAVGGIDPRTAVVDAPAPTRATLDRTENAVRGAHQVIVEHAKIAGFSFLAYRGVVPVLARFCDAFPSASPTAREFLGWYLWRGALTGAHGSMSDSKLRQLLDVIHDEAEDSAIRLLESVQDDPPLWIDWRAKWNARNAQTKLAAAVLLAAAAASNERLVGDGDGFSETFVPAFDGATEHAAYIWRHKSKPTIARMLVRSGISSTISDEAARLLDENNHAAFIEQRVRDLEAFAEPYLRARTGTGAPLRRSVARMQALVAGAK